MKGRIQMKLLSPKNDVVFQKLFGNNENKEILISFLNSILVKAGNRKIVDVKIEEKKLDISMIKDEKISILDIYVTTDDNTHINVEMQIVNEYNMIKRTLFYWSKMLMKQLSKGEEYSKLQKTITINLIDFGMFTSEEFHTHCHIYDDCSKKLITDLLELHFIEMRKFEESVIIEDEKLHKWLSFIINPNSEEAAKMAMFDAEIGKAKEILMQISGDKEITQLAEMREKALRDEMSRIEGAVTKTRVEILIKLLKKKFTNAPQNYLEKVVNLSQDKVELLIENIFELEKIEDMDRYINN